MASAGPALDADRTLALSYVPAARRPALAALWRLDAALGAVLAGGREPLISQIKLAWWREALEKLDQAPPPAEPVLEGVARQVLPRGVSGASLAGMEEGWTAVLPSEPLTGATLHAFAAERGGRLFGYSARLLGGSEELAALGGEAWALVDLARRTGSETEALAALEAARAIAIPRSWPVPLRPLGMLAMLARRDAERRGAEWEAQGAPARVLRMIRHRLTGR